MDYISENECSVDIEAWADQVRKIKTRELKECIEKQKTVACNDGSLHDRIRLQGLALRLELIQ